MVHRNIYRDSAIFTLASLSIVILSKPVVITLRHVSRVGDEGDELMIPARCVSESLKTVYRSAYIGGHFIFRFGAQIGAC